MLTCLLTCLSLQKMEVATQRPVSPIEDRKGMRVLVKPKKAPKAEKQRHPEDAPVPRVGEASSKPNGISTSKAMRATCEVAEMEADCGTIVTVDQVTNDVRRAPSEANNGHSKNVEVVGPLVKKGKASRKYCPKVMEARRPATPGIRVPNSETCHAMLERYVSIEYEELLKGLFRTVLGSSSTP